MPGIPKSLHEQTRRNRARGERLQRALDEHSLAVAKQAEASRKTLGDEDLRVRLEQAGRDFLTAQADLEVVTAARDDLILEASRRGFPRRYVALAAGVTAGRVQQLIDAAGQEGHLPALTVEQTARYREQLNDPLVLEKLPGELRQAIAQYVSGMALDAIAAHLGIPQRATVRRIAKALTFLDRLSRP